MALQGVVFLGPSIPRDLVTPQSIVVRPPAARGDIAAAVREGFAVVGLVDGLLYQRSAVTPEEVEAAARTIPVLGAASMGALRAVDCPSVIAVGVIARAFVEGTLKNEDEVVGTYDPETGAHQALPLVIVRDALDGLVAPVRARAILDRVRALPVPHRTLTAVLRIADGAAPIGELRDRLARIPNVKQRDALELIEQMTRLLVR